MPLNPSDVPWLPKEFFENQKKVTPAERAKYDGQHIAWSWDGSRVVASGADLDEVEQKVIAAGIDPSRVVFDYVPPGDISLLL